MERLLLCVAECSVVDVILRSDNRRKEEEEAVIFSNRETSLGHDRANLPLLSSRNIAWKVQHRNFRYLEE